jgi:putative membrane protein
MGWDYGGSMMFGWMWLWLLLLVALLGAVVWAVARTAGAGSQSADQSPEAILKQRYARGEIDHEEFERRLTGLRK